MEPSSYLTTFQQHLQGQGLAVSDGLLEKITARLKQTQWDDPRTPLDFNNVAVMALIEAETSPDVAMREMYLDMAIAALNEGSNDPLCAAHLALVQSLIGDREDAIQSAFSTLIGVLLPAWADAETAPGLVFLPQRWRSCLNLPYTQQETVLELNNGYQQSVLLVGEILCRSQFVFYNASGLRFLQLATQLFPASSLLNFQLGISSIMNAQWEGLLYLHRAQRQQPNHPAMLQALFLAYQNLGQAEIAHYWQQKAALETNSSILWAQLPLESPFTYILFEQSLQMAVEVSFQSIVTGVLLAQGTWFEQEMEFWQDHLQPGMTAIDVGANVGVYTFSAAQRVGQAGRVLAIEPFSTCVQCLLETRRVNQLEWVTVCGGAASDREGTAYLSLHSASELNQLVASSTAASTRVEEVPCFTLDALIEREQLTRVDILKIDAEGHELQVLQGSDRLLSQFTPVILYENIAGSQGSNRPVAEYLVARGYQLFRYQPFIKQLHPIELTDNLDGSLNIIAMPSPKT
jgi:FkbM family methyltransferase